MPCRFTVLALALAVAAARDSGAAPDLRDPQVCRRPAATARRNVAKRVADEAAAQ